MQEAEPTADQRVRVQTEDGHVEWARSSDGHWLPLGAGVSAPWTWEAFRASYPDAELVEPTP